MLSSQVTGYTSELLFRFDMIRIVFPCERAGSGDKTSYIFGPSLVPRVPVAMEAEEEVVTT